MAAAPAELEPYLPTLEKLRSSGAEVKAHIWWRSGIEVDLLSRDPFDAIRVAAVVVNARVVCRDRTATLVTLPAIRAPAAPEPEPPVLDEAIGHMRRVLGEVVRPPHPCRMCVKCGLCGGRGATAKGGPCRACSGRGRFGCAVCAGSGMCVTVRATSVQDQEQTLRYAYLPDIPLALEMRLQAHVEAILASVGSYPDVLTLRTDRRPTGGPYRQITVDQASFHGFAFGETTLAMVRGALAQLRTGDVVAENVRMWALPILWLRYRAWGVRREVGVISDPTEMRVFVTDGGI